VCTDSFILTDRERQFASEHHQLIYGFLNKHGLPESDYYGVAALGYLRAVHRYLDNAGLNRFSFSTVAYRAMSQSVSQHRRGLNRPPGVGNPLSMDTGDIDGAPLNCGISAVERVAYEELEERLRVAKVSEKLTILEVHCAIGSRNDLGRPTTTPQENKKGFMEYLVK